MYNKCKFPSEFSDMLFPKISIQLYNCAAIKDE